MSKEGYLDLKKTIELCSIENCIFDKNTHNKKPLYLNHKDPDKVRILIVTEQPKIINNRDFSKDFYDDVSKVTTYKDLVAILGEEFNKSIKNSNGSFYWTHHTKCPSKRREPQNICAEAYITKELEVFKNLRLVISFGAYSYNFFQSSLLNTDKTLIDEFYDLLKEQILKEEVNIETQANHLKDYPQIVFLPLPHPSKANPLGHLIKKAQKTINKYIERATNKENQT